MARSYAKSYVSMWDAESDFLDLTADAQWLYQALYTHPLLSPAGVLPFQPRKWARKAKDMTPKRVTAAVELLASERYVILDEDTEECLVRTFIRHDQGWRTPNIRKSIETSITRIESETLRLTASHELRVALTLAGIGPEGLGQGLAEGLGQGLPEGLGQGLPEGLGYRTPPPPQNHRTEDSHLPPSPPEFQSSSTSNVSTRRRRAEDDRNGPKGITELMRRDPLGLGGAAS